MIKFKKPYNLKVVILPLAMVFIITNLSNSYANSSLRIPLICGGSTSNHKEKPVKKDLLVAERVKLYLKKVELENLLTSILDRASGTAVKFKKTKLKKLLTAEKENIFRLIDQMRDIKIEIAFLEKDRSTYRTLQISDLPYCGMCYEVTSCFVSAVERVKRRLKNIDSRIVSFPSADRKSNRHSFAYLFLAGEVMAVDITAGQIFSKNENNIVVSRYSSYYKKVRKALEKLNGIDGAEVFRSRILDVDTRFLAGQLLRRNIYKEI